MHIGTALYLFDLRSNSPSMIQYRTATLRDQPGILDIYNEAVRNTTATFDTEPRSLESQHDWFHKHKKNHPVLVAEENNQVIGWASLSPWSDRCAYDTTVEISVYVHHEHRGKGIGKVLLEKIIEAGSMHNTHTVLSRISSDNAVSIHLHEKAGFKTIGVMKEVGFKFNRFLDVTMLQYMYPNA